VERGILSRATEFTRFRGISIFLQIFAKCHFAEFRTDATNMPYIQFQAAMDN